MNIQVEWFLLLGPLAIAFLLWFFFMLNKQIKLWRYKPENDKGKRGEEFRKSRISSTKGGLLSGGHLLQAESITVTGETSSSPRKTSNPFRRFR